MLHSGHPAFVIAQGQFFPPERGNTAVGKMIHKSRYVSIQWMTPRRSHILRLATCAVLIVATASCGGDSSPTTPVSPTPPSPQPQIPNVAGTY